MAVAVYDACVLFPPAVRDVLMQLAVDGLCRARWTERIHDEWIDAVSRDRPELKDRLARTRSVMDLAVPRCPRRGLRTPHPGFGIARPR